MGELYAFEHEILEKKVRAPVLLVNQEKHSYFLPSQTFCSCLVDLRESILEGKSFFRNTKKVAKKKKTLKRLRSGSQGKLCLSLFSLYRGKIGIRKSSFERIRCARDSFF